MKQIPFFFVQRYVGVELGSTQLYPNKSIFENQNRIADIPLDYPKFHAIMKQWK